MRRVRVQVGDELLCIAEVAENLWTRSRGLLGRKTLADSHGLWIRPCGSVHTWFMRFPIDLVYLTAENTVVKTCRCVRPFRFSFGGRKAHSVIELPAGFLDRVPLAVGTHITMVPLDEQSADDAGTSLKSR
jgi:hypothetical protein